MHMKTFRSLSWLIALSAILVLPATPAQAQDWPQRAVKFIIPFGAGAGADIGARLFSERLAARWGKAVVVENRPGGDGLVAISAFVGANDDHTLLFAASGSFTVHPYLHEKLPYNLERDLLPIARVSNTIVAIAVPASANMASLAQFVARARAEPGQLNAGLVPGITEFVWDGFVKGAGLSIAKVPYRDIVLAVTDLAEGRLQIIMASYAILQPQAQAGRIKVVAVNGRERVPFLPELPTVIEAGFPALELEGLVGLFGPRIMSRELREKIGADVVAVAADPVISTRLARTAQVLNPGGPAAFGAAIKAQTAQVAAIAQAIGLKQKLQ
jgi:tripartite-type tricarboxylate transporter receptor subunit TctC